MDGSEETQMAWDAPTARILNRRSAAQAARKAMPAETRAITRRGERRRQQERKAELQAFVQTCFSGWALPDWDGVGARIACGARLTAAAHVTFRARGCLPHTHHLSPATSSSPPTCRAVLRRLFVVIANAGDTHRGRVRADHSDSADHGDSAAHLTAHAGTRRGHPRAHALAVRPIGHAAGPWRGLPYAGGHSAARPVALADSTRRGRASAGRGHHADHGDSAAPLAVHARIQRGRPRADHALAARPTGHAAGPRRGRARAAGHVRSAPSPPSLLHVHVHVMYRWRGKSGRIAPDGRTEKCAGTA